MNAPIVLYNAQFLTLREFQKPVPQFARAGDRELAATKRE